MYNRRMGAVEIWERALSLGQVSGLEGALVFLKEQNIIIKSSSSSFNLGMIATRLSEYSQAKYYFCKSFVENFLNIEAYSQIMTVNHLIEKNGLGGDSLVFQFLFLLKSGFMLFLFLALIVLYLFYSLARGSKKYISRVKASIFIIILLFLIIFPNTYKIAVLKNNSIEHEGPSTIFKTEKMLIGGRIVLLGRENNTFIEVHRDLGSKTWLSKNKILRL